MGVSERDVVSKCNQRDVFGRFIEPLRTVSEEFTKLPMDGEEDQEEPVGAPVEEEEEVPEPVRAVAKTFAPLSHSPHFQHPQHAFATD